MHYKKKKMDFFVRHFKKKLKKINFTFKNNANDVAKGNA